MITIKKTFIVNIVGPTKIGVTSTCQRIKYALENIGYTVKIVAPRTLRAVRVFEDEYYADKLNYDVVLFDNHHYTASAICTGRRDISFDEPGAVKPNLAMLLVAMPDDYVMFAKLRKDYEGLCNARAIMDKYQNCNRSFFGTSGLTIIPVTGENGRLVSAGKVKNIIIANLKGG